MPRQFFKRILGRHRDIGDRWYLRPVRALMHDPALWTTHRRSVAKAFAAGIFIAFLPIPGHVLLAVLVSIYWRINIGIAAVTTFISNPLTFAPIVLAEYQLGRWLSGAGPETGSFNMSWGGLVNGLTSLWPSLAIGALILATVFSIAGYFALNSIWRWSAMRRYRARGGSRQRRFRQSSN